MKLKSKIGTNNGGDGRIIVAQLDCILSDLKEGSKDKKFNEERNLNYSWVQ